MSNPRHKLMAERLFQEASHGRIDDEWAENFILDMHERTRHGHDLTEKQAAKLEELFERY
jgi:Spy/CpxP family protein refolding chaperone